MKRQWICGAIAALVAFGATASDEPLNTVPLTHLAEILAAQDNPSKTGPQAPSPTQQRFLVQLASQPLAILQNTKSTRAISDNAHSSSGLMQYRNQLDAEVAQFQTTLANRLPQAQVSHRFSTLFNGVAVMGSDLTQAQLAALPGVRAVFPNRRYEVQMDTSLEQIKAQRVWHKLQAQGQAGEGIRIAIVDSGIDPRHEMFSGEGFSAPAQNLPSDDYCRTTDPSFCNNKLIVARWSAPTFPVADQEYLSPRDFGGHGTHVAGTAAGNRVQADVQDQPLTLSGVAPAAYLMVYKALYATADDPDRSSGSDIMLLEALEHAVNDGAQVINNSWGGSPGMDPALTPYKAVFEAIEAAGVVLVTAAGNDGAGAQTVGCPACIEAGITVANTTHGRFFSKALSIAGLPDFITVEGTSPIRVDEEISAPLLASVQADPENVEGCGPFDANQFDGQIALIQRGGCTFSLKSAHAQAAGAVAMVVYNNVPGIPITMRMDDANLPAVMISKTNGEAIVAALPQSDALDATISSTLQRIVAPEFADMMNSSSSRGPNGDPNILKPDIAAPGTSILSAYATDDASSTESHYSLKSGTSMASPHVAGAAALMRQLHPDWSAVEIKTALTSSTTQADLLKQDASTEADPFDVGAGRLDLEAASNTTLTFDKASFANASCVSRCSFTGTVTNRGENRGDWNIQAGIDQGAVTVMPEYVTLAPGASAQFTLLVDPALAPKEEWQFGQVTFSGESNAHLPIAIYPELSTELSTIALFGEQSTQPFGGTGQYQASFSNKHFEKPVTVTLQTDPRLSLLEESVVIDTAGSPNGLTVNSEEGLVTWVGELEHEQITVHSINDPSPPSQADEQNRLSCRNGCDDTYWVLNLPVSYELHGRQYGQVTISSNGFIAAGNERSGSSPRNQPLPTLSAPNNLLAPLWTDLDLEGDGGDDDNGKGGGAVHAYLVQDDENNPTWVVFDWIDAQLFGDESRSYSFGVWLGLGDNEGTNLMRYYRLDPLPDSVTVGAEDRSGYVGRNAYYNGEGSAPVTGDTLTISNDYQGLVNIDFQVRADAVDVAANDWFETQEEVAVTLNVVENDSALLPLPLRLTARSEGTTFEALHLAQVSGPAPTSVVITSTPDNGEVVINDDGTLTYTPNLDFAGDDHLTYQALNEQGEVIGQAEVTVTVHNENDAPRVSEPAAQKARRGETARFYLSANDPDGDAVTWSATQTGGTEASFSLSGNTLEVSVPHVRKNETLVFSLVANDGSLSSEPVEARVRVDVSGAGSVSFGLLLLIPLVLLRRRLH
ncbi:S8 family serine peptidase [Ferrimonas balearica]|uniref:S8 family serine peptidase n=1 Tax=Ferrimonas balearica TaxID=44012 RepID=UPI001C98F46D|nr:S8 family serine peptidase [Ferrimonas balearica]MBY5922930.1 S8 family serine peptidase [Ferrimonas balearica]MBY5997693.1 S8 family serine peptidase [Ferrimonas balearica]